MLSFILLSTLPVRCREDWVCNGFQDWSNVMIIVYILHQTFSQTLGVHKKIRCLCHKILIIPWKYMREGRRAHKIVQKEGPVVHETCDCGWKKKNYLWNMCTTQMNCTHIILNSPAWRKVTWSKKATIIPHDRGV